MSPPPSFEINSFRLWTSRAPPISGGFKSILEMTWLPAHVVVLTLCVLYTGGMRRAPHWKSCSRFGSKLFKNPYDFCPKFRSNENIDRICEQFLDITKIMFWFFSQRLKEKCKKDFDNIKKIVKEKDLQRIEKRETLLHFLLLIYIFYLRWFE